MGSLGDSEKAADVGDAVAIDGDVGVGSGASQTERDGRAESEMGGNEAVEAEIGQDVGVVDEDGLVADPGFDVLQASAGFEEDRFVEEGDRRVAVDRSGGRGRAQRIEGGRRRRAVISGGVGEEPDPFFGEMVGVDGEFADSGVEGVVESVCDEGPVHDRDERLGKAVGEGAESGSQPGAQEKGLRHGGAVRDRGDGFKRGVGTEVTNNEARHSLLRCACRVSMTFRKGEGMGRPFRECGGWKRSTWSAGAGGTLAGGQRWMWRVTLWWVML